MPLGTITLMILWKIYSTCKIIFSIHRKISGQWWIYLVNYFHLKWYQNVKWKKKLQAESLENDLYPTKQDVEDCQPKKNQTEHLFIYGTNTTENTSLVVQFVRRPHKTISTESNDDDPSLDDVSVQLQLHDGKGNRYTLVEHVNGQPFHCTEYRCGGFVYETLEPKKIGRIKFCGYLHRRRRNNDGKEILCFVKLRFLCLYTTTQHIYDHLEVFDRNFLTIELSTPSFDSGGNATPNTAIYSVGNVETILENTVEQYCHIKGIFTIFDDNDDDQQRSEDKEGEKIELHFLATIGKRFTPASIQLPRYVTKIFGFTRKGLGFQLGIIQSGAYTYRYGIVTNNQTEPLKVLHNCSVLNKEKFWIGLNDIVNCVGGGKKIENGGASDGNQNNHNNIVDKKNAVMMKFDAEFQNYATSSNELSSYNFEIFPKSDDQSNIIFTNDDHGVKIRLVNVKVNKVEGMAFIIAGNEVELPPLPRPSASISDHFTTQHYRQEPMVISLTDDSFATMIKLIGVEGESLAQLYKISITATPTDPYFVTPFALVITTAAYRVQLESMGGEFGVQFEQLCQQQFRRLTRLDKDNNNDDDIKMIKEKWNNFSKWFAEQTLNTVVYNDLRKKLKLNDTNWSQNFQHKKFIIRSSATTTTASTTVRSSVDYFDICDIDNDAKSLAQAVMRCWASQFAYKLIAYKHASGQPLNAPIAVVIQEDVSNITTATTPTTITTNNSVTTGVIYTGDCVTGDERCLTVMATRQQPSSSSLSSSNRFKLKVKINSNSYTVPRVIQRGDIQRLDDDNDEKQHQQDHQHKCIINDDQVYQLGEIALKIAQHYRNGARMIKWAMISARNDGHHHHDADSIVYIFQSNPLPVTMKHNNRAYFTTYELMHEMDSAQMTEQARCVRSTRWGENFSGSMSWQGVSLFTTSSEIFAEKKKRKSTTGTSSMACLYNKLLFDLNVSFTAPFMNTFAQKCYPPVEKMIAQVYFGQYLRGDDKQVMADILAEISSNKNQFNWKQKIFYTFYTKCKKYFSGSDKLNVISEKIFNNSNNTRTDIPVPFGVEKLTKLSQSIDESMLAKMAQMYGGTLVNFAQKLLHLQQALVGGYDSDIDANIEHDLHILISYCNTVVSLEIISMLDEIACTIVQESQKYSQTFINADEREALRLLRCGDVSNTKNVTCLFEKFLTKHGHRSSNNGKEFDPLQPTWRMNPSPCVLVIQSMVRRKISDGRRDSSSLSSIPLKERQRVSHDQILNKLRTPMNVKKREEIKRKHLPALQDAIEHREHVKSLLIKVFDDCVRKRMRSLALDMVITGLLPDVDLYFFLKNDEIYHLLSGAGGDNDCADDQDDRFLVEKAKQRRRLYPLMNAFVFEEDCVLKGFRMQPRNFEKIATKIATKKFS